ncbi:MAG: quinoprotein dehydrogenase-associated SoxYZ-like carrier [Hyphomicrobium sp.]|uniref:quinoprotein dehydrogenase-associated SoxYZ-like carrier n=1 Tax=Hyphomicrobium sp. TaxID=82 RepID=UPI0025C2B6E5|nr:quinoprotein dehydrogenase-associated SoxYZ-like carrier [Hyphomicrobium sp.]MBX9861752.1 quinoprotein dehydrogenase-associated SoxYZ-like carrier [Hyphomicrobium sp.]
MIHVERRSVKVVAALAMAFAVAAGGWISANAADADEDIWPALQKDLFGDRAVVEDPAAVVLEAPYRAEDAALVPLVVRIPAAVASSVKKLSLVIDKNPAPLVADFTFGPAAGKGERTLETRVRVDMYSNVRAIVETEDGTLHMATKFVKAAGGCSAPALKDTDAALADAGKMQIKLLADGGGQREAQLKIRHPQYSGLQLNQATGYYIPAKFLRVIDVQRGGDRVFRMEGGISLSENPNIRFTYAGGSDETLKVVAEDTDGRTFTGTAAPKGS